MSKPATVKIHGEVWEIEYGNPGRNRTGCCDYWAKRIVIAKRVTEVERAATLIHECLHAVCPYLTEETVADAEVAIMASLKAMKLAPWEAD